MSENIDPVQLAIEKEEKIAQGLALPADDAARKVVRKEMEAWLELMSPKVRKQYSEEFGELDTKRVEVEILGQISERFPKVAKELGFDPKLVEQYQQAE